MFRATRISPDLFQYIYNSQFCVTIPCHSFVPIVQQVNIARVKDSRIRYRDHFPVLSNFWLEMAGRQIVEGEDLTLRQVTIIYLWVLTLMADRVIRSFIVLVIIGRRAHSFDLSFGS